MKIKCLFVAASFLMTGLTFAYENQAQGEKMTQIKTPDVGEKSIDFTLPYATKDSLAREGLKLSNLFGKGPIVLAFYPADWSGGCTKEMCTFRDNFSALQELNAQIVAISGDYAYSHHEWAKHHNLPFTLVSDYGGKVAKQYASWNEDYGMCKRTVFLIDNQGKIAYQDLEYSVRDQNDFEDLKKALSDLKK